MKRIVYGLLALFSALLLIRASSYGEVGRFIAHTSDRLIGSAGVALLTLVLFVVAFRLLVPASVRRWLLSFPFERAPAAQVQVVKAPRRRAPPRQQLVVVTGADLQGLGLQGLIAAMNGGHEEVEMPPSRRLTSAVPTHIPVEVAEPTVLPPAERMKLDDARGALKQLGYRPYEYESVVAAADPNRPLEDIVRDAIKTLHAKSPKAKVVRA